MIPKAASHLTKEEPVPVDLLEKDKKTPTKAKMSGGINPVQEIHRIISYPSIILKPVIEISTSVGRNHTAIPIFDCRGGANANVVIKRFGQTLDSQMLAQVPCS